MEQKQKVKELLQQFNNPPTFDMDRNGVYELVEDGGLMNYDSVTTFVIKSYIVFHRKDDTKHMIITRHWESPKLEMKDLVEQLVKYSEEFYKAFYRDLIIYTLFAKEIKDWEENIISIPITKLILGK